MSAFLFVYGTLMSSAASTYGRAQRTRLHEATTSLGTATMRGRLYDLGSYPGLVASDDAADIVHGEVLRLDRPDEVLPWLDDYEGIVVGHADNEYARVTDEAVLASGETLLAQVYVWLRDPAGHRRIADGYWHG